MIRLSTYNINDKTRFPKLSTLGSAILNTQRILKVNGDDAAIEFIVGCRVFTDSEKDYILKAVTE